MSKQYKKVSDGQFATSVGSFGPIVNEIWYECQMAETAGQFGLDETSFQEFKTALQDLARLCEKVLRLAESSQYVKPTPPESLPCNTCLKIGQCQEPCELLERQLPKEYGGKIHGEGTINLDLDKVRNGDSICDDLEKEEGGKFARGNLKDMQKVTSVDFFGEYEACLPIFSKKQQQVLALYHRDGKTISQIAKELNKSASTIWGLLSRAEKRLK